MIGFGTWGLQDTYAGVRAALDAGYRHIDTAAQYRNEDAVGAAVRDSGVGRDDVFITTKILSTHIGMEREVVASSLRQLRTDYVDLWLVHGPPPPGASERLWEFMIDLRDRGQARAHGVTPAQVLVRWHVDHHVVALPRSSTPERIAANLDVWNFELAPDERSAIDGLSVVRRRPVPAGRLVGATGTLVAPTGRTTGAGEIELPGEPPALAWSAEPLSVGTVVRVVGHRGPRGVEVVAADEEVLVG